MKFAECPKSTPSFFSTHLDSFNELDCFHYDLSKKAHPFLVNEENYDVIGRHYEEAKKLGFNDIFQYVRLKTDDSGNILRDENAELYSFSHAHWDGASSFQYLGTKLGLFNSPVPKGKSTKPKGIKNKFESVKNFQNKIKQLNSPDWHLFEASKKRKEIGESFLIRFSIQETQDLIHHAQSERVGLNSIILAAINDLIFKELAPNSNPSQWLFPVNMRGDIDSSYHLKNASTGIFVQAHKHSEASDLHRNIKSSLVNNEHWGVWYFGQCSRLFNRPMLRRSIKKRNKKHFHIGTFSNMGAWKSKTAKNEMWFVVAPGSPNYPVGVIPLMWNDQLGISLRIHPSILGKREIAKKVASRFHQQLLSLISTSSKSVNSDSASANIESADSESAQPTPGSFIYPSSGDNSQSASTQI